MKTQHTLPTLNLRHRFDHASPHKHPIEERILVVRVDPLVTGVVVENDVHALLFQSVYCHRSFRFLFVIKTRFRSSMYSCNRPACKVASA